MDKNLISNTLWALVGQIGYILMGLIGSLILARLLTPDDFGTVGIAMFFVGIFNVFVESGMGGALVRKENVSNIDYSTIFIFNLGVSFFLAILLIVSSPFIAQYYNLPDLKEVLIVLSSILIFNAFTITQNAKLIKEMKFRKRGIYKFISLFFAVAFSTFLAYLGYGVWAIVLMQVLSSFFLMLILWVKEGGIGRLVFSKESFREMSSFGLFTTLSSILNAVFENIYQLILGKYFSVSQVGFYYQAKKLQEAPDTVYRLIILQVVYAHLSKLQNKVEEFKLNYIAIAKFCAIVLGLTTCLTFIYAEQIVIIVFGSQWLGSVFYLKMLVIVGFFTLQEMVNRNIFKIYNQTHKIFYLEILKKTIQTVSIVIGVAANSISFLLYGLIITSLFSYFINFYYSRRIVDLVSKIEIINFLRIVFSCVISSTIFLLVLNWLEINGYFALVFIPLFILLYFVILFLLKVENMFTFFKYKFSLKNLRK